MSENTVETTTNVPSLESILWGAAERWSDDPGLVDREEFADYIFEAWGGDSATEDFVSRFFDGDPTVARPNDMAEAMSRASRRTMHVYNFDLNRLEYVVIEDAEQVVLVSEQGQFALPNDDYFMRAIERAIIPGSKDPVGTNGQFDRKQDGTPRAYFVRQTGEIVAVDVDQLSNVIQQKQLELKPVFSPVIDDAEGRLFPFAPVRTAMMPNREVDLLRQDERISSWKMPEQRSSLVSPVEQAMRSGAAGLTAPSTADAAVLLLLPDGTLARPVIGSGSRWRDMVSDWTARAAMISIDATVAPDAVMDDRRYAIQTDRVVAIFSGVRPTSEWDDAPGSVGLSTQSRGETLAAVRMMEANIQALGDDDLAAAILGGAQFVSGLAAPIMADTRPGTGFWMQPEIFFQASSDDQAYAAREMDLRAQGYTNAALETALASPAQDVVGAQGAVGMPGATDDAWSNWALQSGGQLALIGRDVDGGTITGPDDPSTLALFARRGRMIGSAGDASLGLDGGPLRIPSDRIAAFRAPDGTIVYQNQANTQVRFASAQRLVGGGDAPDPYTLSDDPAALAPSPRPFAATIGNRSGALPATALAALATALDRTAAASGYRLPRMISVESADDAVFTGEAMSSTLSDYSERRSHAALMDSPFMTGTVGRMVLSMPFPTAGDVYVGSDLDEALQAWMTSPAISIDSGGGAFGSLGSFGGAAGGAIAGDLALRGGDFSSSSSPTYNMGPSLLNAALVSGDAGAASVSQDGSISSDSSSSSVSGSTPGSINTSGSSVATDFGSNATSSGTSTALASGGSAAASGGSSSGGTNYLIQSPAMQAASSSLAASAFAGGSLSSADLGTLHGAALSRAQNASLILQMPAAADTLSSRSTLARLPKLLARALESSGGWIPGSGAPLPNAVRDFALSSPFDLPELAAIGAFPQDDGPGLISTRVLNPGEEEISIPMPLWAQMGRGRLSTTEAIMASPRMRPGFAPPLGVYRLVSPEMVDLTGGAPESTPGIVTLQGPVEMGVQQSLAGGIEASKMGGQFTLGRIPVADGETVVSRRGRIRIGAPLGSSGDDLSGSEGSSGPGAGGSSSLSSFGQAGSFATASDGIGAASPALEGIPATGSSSLTSSAFSSSAMLGGDAPAGSFVTGGPNVIRVPALPDLQMIEAQEDLASGTASLAPSSSGRPFAGALRSALRMSDDVDSRMMPGSFGSSGLGASSFDSAGGAFSGASSLGGGPAWGSMVGNSSSLVGQPMFGSGGGIASGVAGPEFGGVSSLISGAPQGAVVAGGGSSAGAGGSLSALSGSVDGSSSAVSSAVGSAGGSSSAVSSALGSAGGSTEGISGLPPGAWSGATRAESGYTPWMYGSRFSPSEQSRGGVDFYSGSRLSKPNYPSLPAMLRFRYIGAPLWWTSATGSFGAGTDSDGPSTNTMARSLRSGLSAANSAATIWRSIFVAPGRQDRSVGPGAGGSSASDASDAGAIDQTWDRNADTMASLSSRMALIATGVGGGVAGTTAGSASSSLSGPETVYVAMDSSGRAGTSTSPDRRTMNELNMRIVAAIPPSPPPLADMAAASSTSVDVRPRHSKASSSSGHAEDEDKNSSQGTSRSKIEGSVDAIAQRIYHRIVRRLDSDRERFGG